MQPSMPEAEHIDLHEAQGVDVVLVPLDHLAVLHRRRLDRHQIVEPVAGQHEAAGMLAQMARKADQLARELERQAQPPVGEVEVELRGVLVLDALVRPAPDLARRARAVTSSVRPIALPTSRTAPRAR